MKKFIVETYYTCTFKTVHTLNELNDKELSKIDTRKDGDVEVIDVKLNNRKTKKIGESKVSKNNKIEIDKNLQKIFLKKSQKEKSINFDNNINLR